MPRVAIVGWPQETNLKLAAGWQELGIDVALLQPAAPTAALGPGDVAIGRLDVMPTLDGVEPGLDVLEALPGAGVHVLNRADALAVTHDKRATERALARWDLPRPRTWHVEASASEDLEPPLVLKPRFGSWGRDVFRCRNDMELAGSLRELQTKPWFARRGAIAQELLPSGGFDLRIVVARDAVVGAAERVTRRGEWRTNISLGGTLRPARLSAEVCNLAVAAAAAVGADLVGVDLMPLKGGFLVIDLNGAVEFDNRYSLSGAGVYQLAARHMGLQVAVLALKPRTAGNRSLPRVDGPA
jgi:[lysine-biosynthesis-protein LysW]--L-2-aminoadipate ligase